MRRILAAAALVLAAAFPVPASAAAAPPAAACRIFGYFTWKIPKPSYLGLDEYQLTYNNCGRLVRAWMVCTYLGAHGAHIYEARTGNVVRRGLTRTNCKTFAIGSGIARATLLTGRAGGVQWSVSGRTWYTVEFVH